MKKIISALLVLAVLFSFSACGKKSTGETEKNDKDSGGAFSGLISADKDKKEKTTTTTMPEEDVSHIAKKIEDGRFDNFSSYNEKEKEKIKEYVEKDGYTLEYNPDGSGTLSNEEGSWFVGKGWADNEYTKGVPVIDFGTVTMSSEMEEGNGKYYIFLIRDASVYKVKEYVDAVSAAGFSDDGSSVLDIDSGVISFSGENDSGKRIEIAYSSYGFTVKIILNK